MDVTYIFRYRIPGTFSIEGIFEPIAKSLNGSKSIYVPFIGNNLSNIIRNIVYTRRRQGALNHITGDIHYVMLGLKRKSKNILTIHDCGILYDESKPAWKKMIIKYLWFKWPVYIADKVTTVSEKSRQELIECTGCPHTKIVVVPNYVNPVYVFHKKEFNTSLPRLLHIGSTKNKNLSRVIKAIAGISCELSIIGSISKYDQELLELNHITYHQFHGISLEQIQQEYIKADLVLFVSTYEGFGLPILEAQATGRVLITSDISPCREVAGCGAICVDPTNVLEIHEAVKSVIQDENLRAKVIESGLDNVRKYSMENIVFLYKEIYESQLQ